MGYGWHTPMRVLTTWCGVRCGDSPARTIYAHTSVGHGKQWHPHERDMDVPCSHVCCQGWWCCKGFQSYMYGITRHCDTCLTHAL